MSGTAEYTVQGMTCSSCASDVGLATGTFTVTGDGEDMAVRAALSDVGYQVD